MADDGSAPGAQKGVKNKVVALCCALMVLLINDGRGASAPSIEDDAKSSFVHLPQQVRDPLGAGLPHQDGGSKPNFVHLPQQLRNPRGAGLLQTEGEGFKPVQQETTQEDSGPKFSHLPQHLRNPRGVGIHFQPAEGALNAGPLPQIQDPRGMRNAAGSEGNQPHFAQMPELHNPRGMHTAQIRNPRGMPIYPGGPGNESGVPDGDHEDPK